jgi:spore germination protein YaaH
VARRGPLLLVVVVIGATVLSIAALSLGLGDRGDGTRPRSGSEAGASSDPAGGTPRPTTVPVPGHEVYGYVPYWEMDDGIADHLAATDLTTLALFSVTHAADGSIATGERGYRQISGPLGSRLIEEAHDRGTRVEVVYTSFGDRKNEAFFTARDVQDRAITALVDLVGELGVDGINVDVESMSPALIPAYGDFVARLREEIRQSHPAAEVSVATTANVGGAAMAAAATAAGADRIFVMGYDYRTAGSQPGASAPLARRGDGERSLALTLDLYGSLGVPAERTILGLPLYGMSWPVASPEIGAARTGRGVAWEPSENVGLLGDPSHPPTYDPVESVEFLAVPDGEGWTAIYFDSPASLEPKLALADRRGLAGAGFWAVGYERGVPGYTELIADFAAGKLDRE